jgi:type II secretory pathway pseudopilin PulG
VHVQRAYALVELLVAAAIAFVAASLLIWLAHAAIFAAAHLDARANARSSADRLAERLLSDAAGAWSVFVPPDDVRGTGNADGHEIDFVTEDGAHREYWWAYDFDAASSSVTVYSYVPGAPATAGDAFAGVESFAAQTHSVSDLANPASGAYDPLFAGAAVTPVDVPYAWGGVATGGNHLVRVRLAAAGVDRTLMLAAATAPTHFTVVVDYTPPTP